MNPIVIVYHSGYGHTQKVAEAVAEGSGGSLLAISAEGNLPDGGWEQLAAAKTIVFGSPTYMGSVSWQFKKFADASSKPWYSQVWKNKLAAGFTNSATLNGDKLSTLHYLFTLSQQHSMFWVGTGMMPVSYTHLPSSPRARSSPRRRVRARRAEDNTSIQKKRRLGAVFVGVVWLQTPSRSTSNTSVAFGGITPPAPRAP